MRLLEPIRIRRMELRNRIVMTPTGTNYGTRDGFTTQRERDFFVERAKNGVGLIQLGSATISRGGQLDLNGMAGLLIDDDKYIPKLREVAEAVKAEGAKVAIQLLHAGRHCKKSFTGIQPVAFSIPTYPSPWTTDEPRILTTEQIDNLAEDYAEAARRVRDAGFDAVDFHGSHGLNMIFESFSPLTNMRTDKYGGDLERRARFSVEIIERTRKKVGDDIAIIFRIAGEEHQAGGYSLDDAKRFARILEAAGADIISVTTGPPGVYFVPPAVLFERGSMVPLAKEIKQVVKVPVLTAGRIDSLAMANRILEEGKADLIGVCRPLIADPELIKKTVEGRMDDIRPCLACNECLGKLNEGLPVECVVNPAAGREEESKLILTEKPKKVMVVGGGPAGMEAAIIAKLRGHDVTLYEKSDKLGGQLLPASKAPGKKDWDNLTWYFITQITKLGVKVERGQEITPALVGKLKPDVVIVATGAISSIPDIPGVDLDNVVIANDVLSGAAVIGGRRIVVVGGGFVGVETADFLLDRGKEVTIIVRRKRLGQGIVFLARPFIEQRLRDKGLKVITNANVEEITDKGVVVSTDDKRQTFDADTVVLARGLESCKELARQLEEKVSDLHTIGDCVEPRKAMEAIYEGWRVARTI